MLRRFGFGKSKLAVLREKAEEALGKIVEKQSAEVDSPGNEKEFERVLQQALALTPSNDEDRLERGICLRMEGARLMDSGRSNEAEPILLEAVGIFEQSPAKGCVELTICLRSLACLCLEEGNDEGFLNFTEERLLIFLRWGINWGITEIVDLAFENPTRDRYGYERFCRMLEKISDFGKAMNGEDCQSVADAEILLAQLHEQNDNFEQAEIHAAKSLQIQARIRPTPTVEDAARSIIYAAILLRLGRVAEAEILIAAWARYLQEVAGEDGPKFGDAMVRLARAYHHIGEYEKSMMMLDRMEKAAGAPGPLQAELRLGQYQYRTANAYCLNRDDVAIPSLIFYQMCLNRRYGPRSDGYAKGILELGVACFNGGRLECAMVLLDEGIQIAEELRLLCDPEVYKCGMILANVALQNGQPEIGESVFRRILAAEAQMFGAESLDVAVTRGNFAAFRMDQGRLEEARELLQDGMAIIVEREGPESELAGEFLSRFASLFESEGNPAQADRFYRRSLEILRSIRSADPEIVQGVEAKYAEFLKGHPAV